MTDQRHQIWDILLKSIALLATLIGAYLAFDKHIDTRNSEFQKAYYDERLKTIVTINKTISSLDQARHIKDNKKIQQAIYELGHIYHAEGMIFLNHEMYEGLGVIWDQINNCKRPNNKRPKDTNYAIDCNYDVAFLSRKFQLAARKALAEGIDMKINPDPFKKK